MQKSSFSRRQLAAAPASLVLSSFGVSRALAGSDDVVVAEQRSSAIATRFFARLVELGGDTRPPPRLRIVYTPARTSYNPKTRQIVAPAWSQAPLALKAQVSAWSAAAGGTPDARTLFGEIYNGFMIAHECYHAYQADLGFWEPDADIYESEMIANRGAVAFALESADGARRVDALMGVVKAALAATPRPVPPDIDDRVYYNANLQAIQEDPKRHGWFEAKMMLRAWDQRTEMDFSTIVKRLKQAADAVTPAR